MIFSNYTYSYGISRKRECGVGMDDAGKVNRDTINWISR